jgi:HAD superfamily hydrolase (TIGR01484 family)
MTVKLIVCDVDGCLTPEESCAWDLDAFAELARLSREASEGRSSLAPLALCTGRPQPYAEVLMKLLDIRYPVVCENGAVLYTLEGNRAWFAKGATADTMLRLRELRHAVVTRLLPDFPGAVLQVGKEAQISIFSESPERFPDLKARIAALAPDFGLADLCITSSHLYVNVSIRGVDKGHALDELLERIGIAPEETAAIGDTEGDLPLRERAAFFACPANASPEIRALADYVSPFPDIQGMLDILKRPEMQRIPTV